ncbi:MAG TPA: hypothetical protein VFT18_01535 [Gaiellaceae bacterium]|nr:hypothetical protein [Gaiellaceae bacterium]
MASEERAAQPAIAALPRVDDLPVAERGYDPDRVRDAFEAFRRHVVQLQSQLRVLQAAGQGSSVEPTGHAVRMDALHLIREASAFADVLERDAQRASATQFGKTEQEVRRRQSELSRRETEIERYRQESERQRAEIVNAARNEARQLLADANRQATQELREAEARGAKLLEQSRHQATELTNSARAEVEQTLEWARAQANAIMVRAQQGAEQLLSAAGLGDDAISGVSEAIVRAAQQDTQQAAPAELPERPAPVATAPEPEPEPATDPAGQDRSETSPEQQ